MTWASQRRPMAHHLGGRQTKGNEEDWLVRQTHPRKAPAGSTAQRFSSIHIMLPWTPPDGLFSVDYALDLEDGENANTWAVSPVWAFVGEGSSCGMTEQPSGLSRTRGLTTIHLPH